MRVGFYMSITMMINVVFRNRLFIAAMVANIINVQSRVVAAACPGSVHLFYGLSLNMCVCVFAC